MSRFNESCVVIRDCTIVWDGLNRPEQAQDGSPKYVLKLVIPPNSPDLAEFYQLAQEKLQASKWNGTLPAGGRMPIGQAGPTEFGGMFPGYGVINAKTKFVPEVHAEDVSILDPMQWSPHIFIGQRVNVLVDCYEYDNAGNRGIGTGLQGVQIVSSAQAQRLNLGGAGPDTASAFGGQPAAQAPLAGPAVPQPGPYAPPGAPVGPPPGVAAPQYAPPAPAVAPSPAVPAHGGYVPPGPPTGQPVPAAPPATAGPVAPVPAAAPQQQNFIPPGVPGVPGQ